MSGSNTKQFFAHRLDTNPVQAIPDASVFSIQIHKMLRIGSVRSQAGDRMRNVGYLPYADDPRTLNANRLGKIGQSKIPGERFAGFSFCVECLALNVPTRDLALGKSFPGIKFPPMPTSVGLEGPIECTYHVGQVEESIARLVLRS